MKRYNYRGNMYTISELSQMSGIQAHTLRDRLRRGFSIDQAVQPSPVLDSVQQFAEASFYFDWVNKTVDEVYTIYWNWCLSNDYKPTTKQGFSRQITNLYPMLKMIPTATETGCKRIVRITEYW